MPLIDTSVDLTFYRELALIMAERERRPYLVLKHADPREQWSFKSAYVVAEEDATTWERANAYARMAPDVIQSAPTAAAGPAR